MRLQHHLRMLHKIYSRISQIQDYRNEQTHSWVSENKLSAKARASVGFAPFPVALEKVVDECLCWDSVGFWPERQEQKRCVQCLSCRVQLVTVGCGVVKAAYLLT